MLLAAGRGTRMGALTAARPKPLLEVAGSSLIERHLDALSRTPVHEVVINIAVGGAQVRDVLEDGTRWGLAIHYSDEGAEPLETAGGIVHALPMLGEEPFLVLNGDVYTDFDLNLLIARAPRPTLVMVENPPHHAQGDFGLAANGLLELEPPHLTYSGIALLTAEIFAGWAPGRRALRPVLEAAIVRRALDGLRYDGQWVDVGTPERLAAAERLAAPRVEA